MGTGAASGGGISAATNNASDLAAATDGAQVAVAWSQLDPAGHQQIYLRQFSGNAWNELGGSASGTGVSRTDGASRAPSLAYLSGSLFVAWQQEQGPNVIPVDIEVAAYAGSTWSPAGAGALSPGGVSMSAGIALQPKLAANGGKLHLIWADTGVGSAAGGTDSARTQCSNYRASSSAGTGG